jgi:hypothetical protein
MLGCRINVDVVDADTGSPHDSQSRCFLDQFLVNNGRAPDDDAIDFRHQRQELFSGDFVVDDGNDRSSLIQELNTGRINSIQKKNVESGHGLKTRSKAPDTFQRCLDVGKGVCK